MPKIVKEIDPSGQSFLWRVRYHEMGVVSGAYTLYEKRVKASNMIEAMKKLEQLEETTE